MKKSNGPVTEQRGAVVCDVSTCDSTLKTGGRGCSFVLSLYFSYFIVDILQLFFQHCHVVSQGIPLLLQLTQVCLETNALVVHKLKSFVQRLHLQWGRGRV